MKLHLGVPCALVLLFSFVAPPSRGLAAQASGGKAAAIIDMHLHALPVAEFGPTPTVCSDNRRLAWTGWDPAKPFDFARAAQCDAPLFTAPPTDAALLRDTLKALERYDIRAVTAGALDDVARWRAAAPDRIIPAVSFFNGTDPQGRPILRELAELRRLVGEGKVSVFAEVAPQYRGMSPADPALDPYFALAEELDVPVGVHMGEGPTGGPNVEGYARYRVRAGSPLLLEEVLARHPRLRLYVMHFGSPFVDEMIAMLFAYPQVYVDIAQNDWGFPRRHFHAQLQRLVDAGFGTRILFGSDQMVWPQTIGLAIDTVKSADFLSVRQKQDILHDNAARFLRLP
jgi:predicted TIM-barrel fold metal-dependent hydrolase